MARSRLINRTTLEVLRKSPNTGYIDPNTRLWVEGAKDIDLTIKCSLQPVRGRSRLLLPDGVRAVDSKLVLTKTELLISDDLTEQEADTVIVKDLPYKVINVEDWTGFGLTTDHYRCIIIREDKLNGKS